MSARINLPYYCSSIHQERDAAMRGWELQVFGKDDATLEEVLDGTADVAVVFIPDSVLEHFSDSLSELVARTKRHHPEVAKRRDALAQYWKQA